MGKSVMVWPVIESTQMGDISRAVFSASKSKCLPINTWNYPEYRAKDAMGGCSGIGVLHVKVQEKAENLQ